MTSQTFHLPIKYFYFFVGNLTLWCRHFLASRGMNIFRYNEVQVAQDLWSLVGRFLNHNYKLLAFRFAVIKSCLPLRIREKIFLKVLSYMVLL